jgi:hypothetical protein
VTREDLLSRLFEWLERERLRYREAAHKAGIGTQVILRQCVASEISETSVQYTQVVKAASPLAVVGSALALRDLGAEFDPTVADLLRQTNGERCRHWAFLPQVRFEQTPERWIEACLLGPLRWRYLAQLGNLDDADHALARRLVEETIALVEGETVDFVTALPVGGLRLDRDEIRVENVTVRPLTGEELGDLAGMSFDEQRYQVRVGFGRNFDYYPERGVSSSSGIPVARRFSRRAGVRPIVFCSHCSCSVSSLVVAASRRRTRSRWFYGLEDRGFVFRKTVRRGTATRRTSRAR